MTETISSLPVNTEPEFLITATASQLRDWIEYLETIRGAPTEYSLEALIESLEQTLNRSTGDNCSRSSLPRAAEYGFHDVISELAGRMYECCDIQRAIENGTVKSLSDLASLVEQRAEFINKKIFPSSVQELKCEEVNEVAAAK